MFCYYPGTFFEKQEDFRKEAGALQIYDDDTGKEGCLDDGWFMFVRVDFEGVVMGWVQNNSGFRVKEFVCLKTQHSPPPGANSLNRTSVSQRGKKGETGDGSATEPAPSAGATALFDV